MKTLALILVAAATFGSQILFAQGCLPEGITFTTQEQIDNFQVNYPGCTEIEGTVRIMGFEITNLYGLNVLTSIAQSLKIQFTQDLTNLEGLNNLTALGIDLEIMNNNALTSTAGLENLTSIPEDLWVQNNPVLNDLSGLSNISDVGLDLSIMGNSQVTDLDDLENLLSVENIGIVWNEQITNIDGLINLSSMVGHLSISGNQNLSDISGLQNIQPASDLYLFITENPSLSQCDVQSICEYLTAPGGTIEIHDNAPGCNNTEEVLLACETAIDENIAEEFTLSTNPASSFITLTTPGDLPIEEAIIYNHLGQKIVSTKPVNNTVDVSGLKAGMFILEAVTENKTFREKVLVE